MIQTLFKNIVFFEVKRNNRNDILHKNTGYRFPIKYFMQYK
jgi:hypothetical protein